MTESIENYDSSNSSPEGETILRPTAQQLKDELDLEADLAAERGWKEPLRSERVALALRHRKINLAEAIVLLKPLPGQSTESQMAKVSLHGIHTGQTEEGENAPRSDGYRNPSEPLHEPPVRGSLKVS